MSQFNKGWGNKGRQMDPTGIIAAWKATGGKGAASSSGLPSWFQVPSNAWPPPGDHLVNGLPFKDSDNTFDKAAWVSHLMTAPFSWNAFIANTTGIDIQGTFQRMAFGGLGVALVIVGAMTFTHSEGGARVTIQQAAGKLRKAAG